MSWDTEFIWDSPMRGARDKGAIHHAIATIKGRRRHRWLPALKEFLPDPLRPAGPPQARHLPVGRPDDPRRLRGPATAHGEGQDHRVHGGHRQGCRRAAHGRHRRGIVGPRTTPRHRERSAHLHAGDAAGLKASLVSSPSSRSSPRPTTRPYRTSICKAVPAARRSYVPPPVKQNAELVLDERTRRIPSSRRGVTGSAARRRSPRDAKSKWGVLWLRWGDFNKFWAQLSAGRCAAARARTPRRSCSVSTRRVSGRRRGGRQGRVHQLPRLPDAAWSLPTGSAASWTSSRSGPPLPRPLPRPAGGRLLVGMAQRKAERPWLAHSWPPGGTVMLRSFAIWAWTRRS